MTAIALDWARANAAWHFGQWQVRFLKTQDMKRMMHTLRQAGSLKRKSAGDFAQIITAVQCAEQSEQQAFDRICYLHHEAQLKRAQKRYIHIDELPRAALRGYLGHNDSEHNEERRKQLEQQRVFLMLLFMLVLLHTARHNSSLIPFVLLF